MATNGVTHEAENANMTKDEVGWYFVEQYYTTLSKTPDKLHLFYGKKSQFVYGLEAEKSAVSVGRQDIQERIQKLDFQDCKVRISNVDSQESIDNIVIQVIGETSNKSGEPRKFVQTFILAQQPSGYFVLNDILRFIKEEEEEVAAETSPVEEAAAEEAAPEEEQAVPAEPTAELDAAVVDEKLEEVKEADPVVEAAAPPVEADTAPAVPPAEPAAAAPEPEAAAESVVEEEQIEVPKEPTPTPVDPVAAAPAEPEKPKGPPKPMTWASRAAAAAGTVRPAVPIIKPVVPAVRAAAPAAATPAAAAAAAPAAAAPAAAAPAAAKPAADAAVSAAAKDSGEWQTAGADSKRQNRPQSITGVVADKDTTLGYVKYVTEKVDETVLRQHLETFGPVVYFDVNRAKNCAFIEFGTPAAYQAAVAANPHVIGGENVQVEARRPKASAYGGANYSNNRGAATARGRGGFEGRAGSQGGGRGGFTNGQSRGRGGAATRGRGASQVATA